jgi:hypothetical protein
MPLYAYERNEPKKKLSSDEGVCRDGKPTEILLRPISTPRQESVSPEKYWSKEIKLAESKNKKY